MQLNKNRLVTNLSTPKNRFLNDVLKAEKIAKKFYDDSKNWRLHGFQWLKKKNLKKIKIKKEIFVDTTTNLGSKAAPAHFDCIGFVLTLLSSSISKTEKKCFQNIGRYPYCNIGKLRKREKFVKAYRKECKVVTVKLAPSDPKKKREKAFENSTKGNVLGVLFDTKT